MRFVELSGLVGERKMEESCFLLLLFVVFVLLLL